MIYESLMLKSVEIALKNLFQSITGNSSNIFELFKTMETFKEQLKAEEMSLSRAEHMIKFLNDLHG